MEMGWLGLDGGMGSWLASEWTVGAAAMAALFVAFGLRARLAGDGSTGGCGGGEAGSCGGDCGSCGFGSADPGIQDSMNDATHDAPTYGRRTEVTS